MVFLNDQVCSDKGSVWRWDGVKWVYVPAGGFTRDQPPSSEVLRDEVVNSNAATRLTCRQKK
jgi:hypothetical protein